MKQIIQQTEQQERIELVAKNEFKQFMEAIPEKEQKNYSLKIELSRIGIQSLQVFRKKGRREIIVIDTPHLDEFINSVYIMKKVLS